MTGNKIIQATLLERPARILGQVRWVRPVDKSDKSDESDE